MDKLKDILEQIYFSIIIWDNKQCTYTNSKIQDIKQDQKLDTYLHVYPNLAKYYTELMETKKDKFIVIENQNVTLHYLCDDIFYEIRHFNKYPYDYHTLLSISNKLRGPLTNIIGILTLMEGVKISQTHQKYMNIIQKSSYQIVSLANDIIDIINLSQFRVELKNSKIMLRPFMQEIIKVIETHVQISAIVNDNVPRIINIDSGRLKQILVNIINNAVHNTDIGSISVHIDSDEKAHSVTFKIKDTGNGIDEEKKVYIDKILNVTNDTEMKPYHACGFGLLISKYLVGLMGGHIWYETHAEIGTTFNFNVICGM